MTAENPISPDVHLSFCMNVFPCATYEQLLTSCFEKAPEVFKAFSQKTGYTGPFSCGLWFGAEAAQDLTGSPEKLNDFRRKIDTNDMYVNTLNAFPYGEFHGRRIKTDVYLPDWSMKARLDYTINCIKILSALLPEGTEGTISTLPFAYHEHLEDGNDFFIKAEHNIIRCAEVLRDLEQKEGKVIRICFEPEPDCILDGAELTAGLLSAFYTRHEAWIKRYIGMCLDTVHSAVRFEDPYEQLEIYRKNGINIYKVQLACALETVFDKSLPKKIGHFNDDVYLHQAGFDNGECFADIPYVLNCTENEKYLLEHSGMPLRVHYHLPFSWQPPEGIKKIGMELDTAFFRKCYELGARHFESEIYTLGLLADDKLVAGIIADDLTWLMGRIH